MSKMTVKKQASLAPISAEMAAEAREGAASFATGSPRISFKGGRITIDKEPVKDNKLALAVITTVLHKAYYDKPYDEGSPSTPVCYAFHEADPTQMKPHPASPQVQSEACKGCKFNEFGTAAVGKGKACRDIVRVMAIVPDAEDFNGAESRMFDVTGNSLKTWNDYGAQLRMKDRAPTTVVTQVSTEPFKAAFRQTYTHVGDLTTEQWAALKSRRDQARQQMMQAYPTISDEEGGEQAPKRKGKKGVKF